MSNQFDHIGATSITIGISQTIRTQPYEMVKPSIDISFDLPSGTSLDTELDIEEFYKEKYPEVKRIWNLHLYSLLYDTTKRRKAGSAFKHVQSLISEETFPTYRVKKKPSKKGG